MDISKIRPFIAFSERSDFESSSGAFKPHNTECRLPDGQKPLQKRGSGLMALRNPYERVCKRCDALKGIEFFAWQGKTRVRSDICKSCDTEMRREAKRAPKRNALQAMPWEKRIKQIHEERFASYIKSQYRMTIEHYKAMKKEQNNKCAICGIDERDLLGGLFIDHDHQTGAVRGLLCMDCNFALGLLHDNINSTTKAVEYLRKYDWT